MKRQLPYVSNGMHYETLWDHIQNMALYGVSVEDVSYWKSKLRDAGAKSFRVVKNDYGKAIICFKWIA